MIRSAFHIRLVLAACLLVPAGMLSVAGCDGILGSKADVTTDEIFAAGRSEPGFFETVEYVPLFPFYDQSGMGGILDAPSDVYVGFDEFLYVTDRQGLHVLDIAGRATAFLAIPGGATSVIQDRRLHVYVTTRRDTMVSGRIWNLPVVLRYSGMSTGIPQLEDIIWHPFDDDSRKFGRPEPMDTDEEVEFTGVAVRANNEIYVSRRGPVNSLTSVISRHNTVLLFSPEGENTGTVLALDPLRPTLLSAIDPVDVLTTTHPPQRSGLANERHFVIAQRPSGGSSMPYPVLSVLATETDDGLVYSPDTDKIQIAGLAERGDGFLYDEFKFESPSDLAFSADGSNYLFVLDDVLNKLFVFTNRGVEGVAPPPGAGSNIPVIVSFGSEGDGAHQFRNPQGVAYFEKVVYVADTGNNRISRFRLNTDFE